MLSLMTSLSLIFSLSASSSDDILICRAALLSAYICSSCLCSFACFAFLLVSTLSLTTFIDPMCPVLIFMFVSQGGRLVIIRRVETLAEECVITVCVSEVFQSPGSQGYEVSSDRMSSYTVRPTTDLWLSSPRLTRVVSSYEKRDHPHSFSNVFLSRSSDFQRFFKI